MAAPTTTASASAATATGTTGVAGSNPPIDPDTENVYLSNYLYIVVGSLAAALIIWRVTTVLLKYVRTVTSLNNDTQRYFASSDAKVSWFKRNIQYAPIFRNRHNREIQLSSAINIGTLPTRFQLFFLTGYFAINIAFCVIDIPFHGNFSTAADQLRNRTGVLAVVSMVPLVLLAGRNNPLIRVLGISFDTFNLLHRWFGRIVVLEVLAHALAYFVGHAQESGWQSALTAATSSPFMLFGFISAIAVTVIGVQALSPFRRAFYETFKIVHIVLVALTIATLWYHLKLHNFIQIQYLYAVIVLWIFDRAARIARIAYGNLGKGGTRTIVEALPGNACRVTVTMARPWTFRPGQHAYLYMPTIGLWQSHPFSVTWSEEAEDLDSEKEKGLKGLVMNRQDVLALRKNTISFVVRARSGFTRKLWDKASASKDGRLQTRCLVEGPYGDMRQMHSYGTVMLFAGGVGITYAVPHVRELIVGFANRTVATRKIVLVWIIQSPEHLEWIRPWMTQILALDQRRECLRVMLFISRPRSTKEIHSPSSTVQMFPGRPNVETLLNMEMEDQIGTMGVTVCGPGSLSDEVRGAVRQRQYDGSIDFIEEAFSW